MLSAIPIAGFLNQAFLQSKSVKRPQVLLVDTSWMKSFLMGHGQKWVWPIWSLDSKIDCISRKSWWNKLIVCMLIRGHKIKSWSKIFGGGHGQKWVWPVWSWYSKMNRWNKVIFSCCYEFRKAKSWFNYFWVGMVKKCHLFLVHEALKSVVP